VTAVAMRVSQLVALAGSPATEEARTAAYQACRLIRERGLQVIDPAEKTEPAPASETSPCWRTITVRHQGQCRACGGPVVPGVRAAWLRGYGLEHVGCHR
jgi:hypothetical protein